MPLIRQSAFSGGEVAPNLQSRTDLPSRADAVRTLRNFIPAPTGAALNRAGFQLCGEAQAGATRVRLIPFTFSSTQSYVIELGHLYYRVWQGGGMLPDIGGGLSYVVTPYTESQLARIQFTQSGDVLTLTHMSHPPREIRRTSATTWPLSNFSIVRTVTAPTAAPTAIAGVLTAKDDTHAVREWDWVVTAVKDGEESLPSPVLHYAAIQTAPDRPITLQSSAVTGAVYYNWYRGRGGCWGYIGNSTTTFFLDEGQVPNYSDRPTTQRDPFPNAEYPGVATYHQQRLTFANQPSYPQRILTSRTGMLKNFDFSLPQKDDDSIDFTVASRQYEEIRGLVSLRHLVILTANTEFVADGGDKPMSPTNINLVPVSFNGSSTLHPLVIDNVILYLSSQRASIRELAFDGQRGGWGGSDVTLVANHLLASGNRTIVDWTYQRLPYPIVWAVRDDGKLISLTYARDLTVAAWAQHDTDGLFESVCAVPEGSEDALYAVVKRTINGVARRFIERMATRVVTDSYLACFLDASVWYYGYSQTTFTGLDHLEGKHVTAVVNGVVQTPAAAVTGGSITLSGVPGGVISVFIGLPYNSDIELLDLFHAATEMHAQLKNVSKVIWEVDQTAGLSAGESFASLTPWTPPLGFVPSTLGLWNEQFVVPVNSTWNRGGRAVLRQTQPLPVSVLGASREVALGGL